MLIGMFVRGDETYFRQILMTSLRENDIVRLFEQHRKEFFEMDGAPLPEVEFTPGRTRETEAVAYVDGCPHLEEFAEAAKAWATVPVWDLKTDLPCIKAAFVWSEKSHETLVQLIEARRVILPGSGWFTSAGDKNTLQDSPEYAMHFDNHLLAVIRGDQLFFKSFAYTSRVFDLADYMQEATTDTARQFFALPNIGVEGSDVETAVDSLTKLQLKRIPKILALGYVNIYTAEELAKRALETKKRLSLCVSDGRLIMPNDVKARDDFLLFLSGRIVSSYLDDENDYETDSVRKIDK